MLAKNQNLGDSFNHEATRYLINYISIELLAVCALILYFYLSSPLYLLTEVLTVASLIIIFNLILINHYKNIELCGHVLCATLFLTVLICNYLVRGINPLFSIWFYVIPVLSMVLTGRWGLILYSSLSLLVIVSCGLFSVPPYYSLTHNEITSIGWINHLLAFIIIVNILSSFSEMIYQFEKTLKTEKNKYIHLARFDALTSLPNRPYFLLSLKASIETLQPDQAITLFFMDLDNLKSVNDHEGHKTGDSLLKESASRLKACFRKQNFLARLSGDEFTAYAIHARSEDIPKKIVQRIELAFQKDFQFKEKNISSSISIGWATYPEEAKNMSDLLAVADAKMYQAKKRKKVMSNL